jgi:hypothetical protein
MKKETNSKAPLLVVGIRGVAGSGKDYVSDAIIEEFPYRSEKLKNASFMKDMLNEAISKVFLKRKKKLSEEEFESMKNDNEVFPIDPEMNVREMLQYLGTDIIRSISPHFHVKQLASSMLKTDKKIILVPDVRFPNEEKFIEQYNKLQSNAEKQIYLKEVSSFTPDQFLSLEGSLDKMKEMFGDNDFTNYIYDYLRNNIVVENKPEKIEKIEEREGLLSEPVEYPGNFDDALRAGMMFVLRDSDRDLDTSHSSESYNVDMAKESKSLDDPSQLVFENNNNILKNKQFVTVIKQIILELIRTRPTEKEYVYSEELVNKVESTNSLLELRILMDEIRTIDTKHTRKIIKGLSAATKGSGKKSKPAGSLGGK